MATSKKWGLLLAPGAGSSADFPALLAVEAVMPTNVAVHRMDFPYRLAGRKAPDRQPVLVEALVNQAKAFARQKRIPMARMFLGGRSMGGRIASVALAEGLEAAGLLLISYPLHPPGRPDKLRVDHFPNIDQPCLFVSGTRDAFGTPAEIKKHTRAIAGDVEHHWIEGGDHGLKNHDDEMASAVLQWITAQIR